MPNIAIQFRKSACLLVSDRSGIIDTFVLIDNNIWITNCTDIFITNKGINYIANFGKEIELNKTIQVNFDLYLIIF